MRSDRLNLFPENQHPAWEAYTRYLAFWWRCQEVEVSLKNTPPDSWDVWLKGWTDKQTSIAEIDSKSTGITQDGQEIVVQPKVVNLCLN
jgi:hypothetical protein